MPAAIGTQGRRRAPPVHRDRCAQLPPELTRRRKVIGVRVRVEQVPHAEPLLGRERQVRKAAPAPHLFENRAASLSVAGELFPRFELSPSCRCD